MKKMTIVMLGFSIIMYGVGLFFTDNVVGWTMGILFGLIIASLKLKLMENTLTKAVTMPEHKAKAYTQRQYMIRYLLTGVVLLIAVLTPEISLMGVFIGLLSMKVGAYFELYTK